MGSHPNGFVDYQYTRDGVLYILTIHFRSSLYFSTTIMTQLPEFFVRDQASPTWSLALRVGYHSTRRGCLLPPRRHVLRLQTVLQSGIHQCHLQEPAMRS